MKTHIIIHHSATKDSGTVSWGAIRRYHTVPPPAGRGWSDIGYHLGVELVGDAFEVLMGRMVDQEGSHCKEEHMNLFGIGLCLVGDFDAVPPEMLQVKKALEVCRFLMRTYGIEKGAVLGHREVGLMAGFDWRRGEYKSCPGKLFDMDAFRGLL